MKKTVIDLYNILYDVCQTSSVGGHYMGSCEIFITDGDNVFNIDNVKVIETISEKPVVYITASKREEDETGMVEGS